MSDEYIEMLHTLNLDEYDMDRYSDEYHHDAMNNVEYDDEISDDDRLLIAKYNMACDVSNYLRERLANLNRQLNQIEEMHDEFYGYILDNKNIDVTLSDNDMVTKVSKMEE